MNSFRLAALSAVLLSLFALPARADLNVVTTVPDLAAITRSIGGKNVTVTTLALPTQDPHFVDAKPNLALALNRADLLIAVGLDLEIGWLTTLQLGARNSKIQTGNPGYLDASQFVKVLEAPTVKVDRSQGDVHPGGNPHYLHDPRMAVAVARGIEARMEQLDSKNAALYKANLEKFASELEAARAGWETRVAGLRGVPVVSYHKTTAYLGDWLGFTTIGYLEPKPGIPPNPSHVAQVLTKGRQQKARLVVQEEYYPDTTSKLVASKIPSGLVILPSGAKFSEGETYFQRLERLVKALEQGLSASRGG